MNGGCALSFFGGGIKNSPSLCSCLEFTYFFHAPDHSHSCQLVCENKAAEF
jgi:hypothetical protein